MNENETTHKSEINATMAFTQSLGEIILGAIISAAHRTSEVYRIIRF